jgi:8-amino-7-oxononanoate synthase
MELNSAAETAEAKTLVSLNNKGILRQLNTPISGRNQNNILINGKKYWDFTSNDALSLSSNPKLITTVQSSLSQGFGSTGSRLLSGDSILFHQLEKKIATFLNKETSLLFNSGYHANCGIIPALFNDTDLIISDKLCHASLLDGIKLSSCKHLRFKHNDLSHLKKILAEHRHDYKRCVIATESIFSMDGDSPNFETLIELKSQFDCLLYVDAAHSFGVVGEKGQGLKQTKLDKVDLFIATFGKALGSYGAFVACSSDIKQVLINKSRPFMFSTALPLPIIYWNSYALDLMETMSKERQSLKATATWFKDALTRLGYSVPSTSHIIPVIIGSIQRTQKIAETLQSLGFWVKPIRYPTVPEHQARLRFSLTTAIPDTVLKKLIHVFETSS